MTAEMATISIVVPSFNEEARLPALLAELDRAAATATAAAGFELREVLIVDDGSSDRSREILRQAEGRHPRVRAVLDYEDNRGKGAAVATGIRHAEGDFVLIVDVDLSTPLGELAKLAAARGEAPLVVGSRALDDSIVERGPAHRKLLGRGFNATVRALTGLRVRDTQCGFKLIETGLARELVAEQICPGFAYDVELLLRAEAAGVRVLEVPVLYVHDSRSRVRVASSTARMLRDVIVLSRRIRPRPGARRARRELVPTAADDAD